jgi:hypothetical protein
MVKSTGEVFIQRSFGLLLLSKDDLKVLINGEQSLLYLFKAQRSLDGLELKY